MTRRSACWLVIAVIAVLVLALPALAQRGGRRFGFSWAPRPTASTP